MSDYEYLSIIAGVIGLCVVTALSAWAIVNRPSKHVHKWGSMTYSITEIYGDKFGGNSDKVFRRETDVSGICVSCRQPLHRRIDGVWQAPSKRATPPTTRTDEESQR